MTEESSASPNPSRTDSAPQPSRGGARNAVWAVALVLLLAAAIVALRWALRPAEPPLWAALPVGADLYVHVDLAALRGNPAVAWYLNDPSSGLPGARAGDADTAADADNETRQFVEATGFAYQRDLHQFAAARKDGQWIGVARLTMDRRRFEDYLRQRATVTGQLASAPVYTFGGVRSLRVALVSDRELVFSIGEGEDGLAQAMLMLAQRTDARAAAATLEKSLAAPAAAKWRAVMARPLWLVGDGQKLLAPELDGDRPTLSGFLLGEETLAGVESLLVSLESGALTLAIDSELICKPGVAPKPLADNLTLLASMMRPRAPEPGVRDLRPLWDALTISSENSSVLIRWRPTPQMLSLLAGEGK